MFLTLFFVAGVGLVISTVAFYGRDIQLRNQGYAAGWHITTIAKAARVYVRDNSINPVHPTSFANLQVTGGIEVDIDDLIDNGYLPPNFSAVNPLGQTVRIFAYFYPVVAPGAADPDVNVPTAYVLTDDDGPPRINTNSALALMDGARSAGLSASAPLFVNGANLSDNCGGSAAVMIWDTGCLNDADIALVTGGTVNIAEGQVMVPAWKSVQHDVRALMRYFQPENPGANVMSTNMFFGTANLATTDLITNQPYITPTVQRSGILNVASMDVSTLVASDNFNDANGAAIIQAPGFTGDQIFTQAVMDDLALNTDYDLSRSHQQVARFNNINLNNGRLTIDEAGPLQGALRMMPGTTLTVNGADGLTARNLTVTGIASATDTNTDFANLATLSGFDTINSTDVTVGAAATLNVTNELVTQNLSGGTIFTNGGVNILGPLNNTGNMTISGGTVGTPAASIRATKVETTGNINVFGGGSTVTFTGNLDTVSGTANIVNLNIRQKCFGDCPEEPLPSIPLP